MTRPPDLKELDGQIEQLNQEKESAVAEQDFEKAAHLRDQADKLKKKKETITKEWRERSKEIDGIVDEEVIREVVNKMTGVPLTRISADEPKRLLTMEDELHRTVISQHEAIVAIAKAVRKSRAGLKDPKRPIGSFIFAGPTGVGKTLLAKRLAQFMFGDENALVQLDMSEYMEKHNVSRLTGALPGYIGYEEGGQLTEKIRRRPYSVVLLDEIEKAHPDVWNILLQIMEEGRLTDNVGRTVDFKNAILIMTTNIGASEIQGKQIFNIFGKRDAAATYDRMKDMLKGEMEKAFRPEFLNRLDDIIVFRALTSEDLKRIIDIELTKVKKRLKDKGLAMELTDEAKQVIIDKDSSLEFGARPLRRAIENMLEDPLAEKLLHGDFDGKTTITVRAQEENGEKKLTFEASGTVTPPELATAITAEGKKYQLLPQPTHGQPIQVGRFSCAAALPLQTAWAKRAGGLVPAVSPAGQARRLASDVGLIAVELTSPRPIALGSGQEHRCRPSRRAPRHHRARSKLADRPGRTWTA